MAQGVSENAPVLEFKDLHKEFKLGVRLTRVHAVRGVSLRVEPGEIFGYLGPNGAGKTTTMKMAMGLIQPTGGELRVFGQPVSDVAVRSRIGYLPENPYFYDYLTAREILEFYGKLFGLSRAKRRQRADELIELVGLSDAHSRRLRGFSKGMLQRVGIAQALVNDPDLIVLDEPLSGLDPIGRKEVRDIIVSLRQRKKTIFFSSHILHDIEMICDRVAIIDKGVIERVGKLDEMLQGGSSLVDVLAYDLSPGLHDRLGELADTVVEVPSGVSLSLDEARLPELLKALMADQARVKHVAPHRDSLEDLFVREATTAGGKHGVVEA